MMNSQIKTTEHLILYIDMLGSSDRIENDADDESLNTIDVLYEKSLEYAKITLHNLHSDRAENIKREAPEIPNPERLYLGEEDWRKLKVKIFSDNIVFAWEIPEDENKKIMYLETLISTASYFQSFSFLNERDWLLRGGITIGKLYIDDKMVWGKGLIKAVGLEKSNGDKPRIVIDPDVSAIYLESWFKNHQSIVGGINSNPSLSANIKKFLTVPLMFRKDSEEIYFVDYECHLAHDNPTFYLYEFSQSIKRMQIKAEDIEDTEKKDSVHKKHKWVINHHNEICVKYGFPEYCVTEKN